MNSTNEGSESLAELAESIVAKARKLRPSARRGGRRATAGGGHSGGLDRVQAAAELAGLAAAALQLSVQQARAAGRTWQEIGELLGVSRQAAFQRFGRPADPRTGVDVHNAVLFGKEPGEP
jgi:hypothetical protein